MASVSVQQVKALARRASALSHRKLSVRPSRENRGVYEIIEAPYWLFFEGTLDQCAAALLGYIKLTSKGRKKAAKKNPAGVSARAGKWSKAYKDSLPDSHFIIVDKRGDTKMLKGKTHPLSRRHLPYKDKAGNVNIDHLRNAISRAPQTTSVPMKDRKAAQARARKLLGQLEGK